MNNQTDDEECSKMSALKDLQLISEALCSVRIILKRLNLLEQVKECKALKDSVNLVILKFTDFEVQCEAVTPQKQKIKVLKETMNSVYCKLKVNQFMIQILLVNVCYALMNLDLDFLLG